MMFSMGLFVFVMFYFIEHQKVMKNQYVSFSIKIKVKYFGLLYLVKKNI